MALTLDGALVWRPGSQVNQRRCVEAPFHLVAAWAALVEQASRELCSVRLVNACCKAGQGFELLRVLLALDKATRGGDERVAHYRRWLFNDVNAMKAGPQWNVLAACSVTQPLSSLARRDLLSEVPWCSHGTAFWRSLCCSFWGPWWCPSPGLSTSIWSDCTRVRG